MTSSPSWITVAPLRPAEGIIGRRRPASRGAPRETGHHTWGIFKRRFWGDSLRQRHFRVDVHRRLFVPPDRVQRRALPFAAALFVGLEVQRGDAATDVADLDAVEEISDAMPSGFADEQRLRDHARAPVLFRARCAAQLKLAHVTNHLAADTASPGADRAVETLA